jgi:DNA-directed RNA polymerase subunit F
LFNDLITESNEFNFNADDIIRVREEMKVLLERLSIIYVPWKAEQERTRDKARKAKKLEREKAKEAVGESMTARFKENSNANIACDPTSSLKSIASSSCSQSVEVVNPAQANTMVNNGEHPTSLSALMSGMGTTLLWNVARNVCSSIGIATTSPNVDESQVVEVEYNRRTSPASAQKNVTEQRVEHSAAGYAEMDADVPDDGSTEAV